MRGFVAVLGSMVLAPGLAGASSLVVSTAQTSTIDGVQFLGGDMVAVDEAPGSATLFLSEAIFAGVANVDAAAPQPDGTVLLSTDDTAQIGGTLFEDGDLIRFDPQTGIATAWLDDDVAFFTDVDIDAAHVLEDGRVLLSVRDDETFFPTLAGEASYLDGDVILYDPVQEVTSLFLGEEIFTWNVDEDGDGKPDFANPDVDGLSMLADGTLLLSIRSAARIGEEVFRDGEIIAYDLQTGTASLELSLFERSATNLDLDAVAVYVPEPGSRLMATLALASAAALARRRS